MLNFWKNLIIQIRWGWVLSHFFKLDMELSERPSDGISEITISDNNLSIVDVSVGQDLIWITEIENNAPGILLLVVTGGNEISRVLVVRVENRQTNLRWDQI